MYCEKCGKEIEDNAKFCPYCGLAITRKVDVLLEDTPATNTIKTPVKPTVSSHKTVNTTKKTTNVKLVLSGVFFIISGVDFLIGLYIFYVESFKFHNFISYMIRVAITASLGVIFLYWGVSDKVTLVKPTILSVIKKFVLPISLIIVALFSYNVYIYYSSRNIQDEPSITAETNTAQSFFDKGMEYFDLEDWNTAILEFNDAIRLDPHFALAYSQRGQSYFKLKEYDRAIADLTQAIRLDPNNSLAYVFRGAVYFNKKEPERAIVDFNQAIMRDPNNSLAFYNRGVYYFYQEKFFYAISDFERAARLDPNNDDAKKWLEEARRYGGR